MNPFPVGNPEKEDDGGYGRMRNHILGLIKEMMEEFYQSNPTVGEIVGFIDGVFASGLSVVLTATMVEGGLPQEMKDVIKSDSLRTLNSVKKLIEAEDPKKMAMDLGMIILMGECKIPGVEEEKMIRKEMKES